MHVFPSVDEAAGNPPAALAEAEVAAVYLEDRAAGLGVELRDELQQAFERVRANPPLFPRHGRTNYRKCFVRRFPYTIYFLDLPDYIWVAAIAHGSRRPDYWRNRLPSEVA